MSVKLLFMLKITRYMLLFMLITPLFFMVMDHSLSAAEILLETTLHDDVDYIKYHVSSQAGGVTVYMVRIDLDGISEGRIVLEPARGGSNLGQCSTPSSIGQREGAIAAINGPYFGSSGGKTYPLGFTVMEGRIEQLGNLDRPMVGISEDGEFLIEVAHPRAFVSSDIMFEPIWLWGINCSAGANSVTLYNNLWGDSIGCPAISVEGIDVEDTSDVITIGRTRQEPEWDGLILDSDTTGSVDIPDNGYALAFRGSATEKMERYQPDMQTALYAYDLPDGWESMDWIVTLGPWFVHDGHLRDYSDETDYGSDITGRAQRSVIGLTWNGEVFFAVTRGASLNVSELADVLAECNVREAVMCDSGGSSGLWMERLGAVGSPRAVPLAFIVREAEENEPEYADLKVWEGNLHRY